MNLNHFEYSKGNRKIGTDTIIFNMGSATNALVRNWAFVRLRSDIL